MAIDTSPLSKALAAHASALRRQRLVVPEWDNATIWFDPLTCGDIDRLDHYKSPGEYNVQLLIHKAEDEHGKKLFSLADKRILMEAPHTLINRICLTISAGSYGRIDLEGKDKTVSERVEELGEP